MKDKDKIALFIDADNAPAAKIDVVLSELAKYGVVNIRKAYGNWKCAMLPLSVLDYVIVHELAHLEEKSHSPSFWRTVEKVMPNYEEAKTWLKFNGAGMSL